MWLERLKLKAKVDAMLAKGATPKAGKLNNYDLNVTIQWFKRDGDKATPKKKEGLLLCYRVTHTHAVHDGRGAYQHDDVAAAVADASHFAFVSASATTSNLTPRLLLWRMLALKLLPMYLLPLIPIPQSPLLLLASLLLALPSSPLLALPSPS
jgi:hypothetical protein